MLDVDLPTCRHLYRFHNQEAIVLEPEALQNARCRLEMCYFFVVQLKCFDIPKK